MTESREVTSEAPDRNRLRCFVIGPIGSRLAPPGSDARLSYEDAVQVLEEIILPACERVGLKPIRADGLTRAGEITEQIFRRLRDDDVVIADLTDANPNVMYELGLRHTKNALTVQIGEYKRLPFDITVIRTVQFSRSAHGLVTARNELIEILETGLTGEYDAVTATRVWSENASAQDAIANDDSDTAPEAQEDDSEPPGFIDLIAEGEEQQQAVADATNAVGARIAELGEAATAATDQMAQSDRRGGGMKGRLAVAARYAHEIDRIAQDLEAHVSAYESAMVAVSGGNLALIERLEEDPSQLAEAPEFGLVIRQFAATARNSLESQHEMTESMQEAARGARILRAPTRRVISALDRFTAATQTIDEWDRRLQALGVPIPTPDWQPTESDSPTEQNAAPKRGTVEES